MLKKYSTQIVTVFACVAFALMASACAEEVPDNAGDDAGEGKDEFPMGEEPKGDENSGGN